MQDSAQRGELRRHLGPFSCIMVTVGSVIGAGIFMKPLEIAQKLPDPTWILGTWIAVGLVSLAGALAYAELGAMFPEAGGQYAYIREGFGRFPAFLYGWCLYWIINAGTMAGLAIALGDNLSSIVPLDQYGKLGVAAGMVLLIATINHFGVRYGSWLQNISTTAKLLALATIVFGGLFAAGRGSAPVTPAAAALPIPSPDLLNGVVAACVAIFWAYEGWNQLPFNAAEIKNPKRDLPRGLVVGTLILIGVYVTVNAVYLHLVPQGEMRTLAEKIDVPKTVADRIFGAGVGTSIVLLVCLSVFGAANTNMLSAPRGFFAMAKDGLMPRALLWVHPRFKTPSVAIWTQAAWTLGIIFIFQDFTDVTIYVIFAALIFYGLTVAAVYRLRKSHPDRERPYRCFGYPVTPAIFIVAALVVDGVTLLDPAEQKNALIGLAIIATGVPCYFLFNRRRAA